MGDYCSAVLTEHLHHFSRQTLTEICRRSGSEVFHFQRYWQVLEFGYLQDMAAHLKIPAFDLVARMTPNLIRRLPIPYYASQTTALARLTP